MKWNYELFLNNDIIKKIQKFIYDFNSISPSIILLFECKLNCYLKDQK